MRILNRVALIPLICLVAVLAGSSMASFFDPHIPNADQWSAGPSSPSPIRVASRNTAAPAAPVTTTHAPPASTASTTRPTAKPTPLADPTPTATQAVTESTAVGGSSTTATLLQQVDEAIATLRTGEIDAELIYLDGSHSFAAVRFDLGDDQRVPRFQITTTYGGVSGTKTVERITIGDRAWQRESGSQWIEMQALEPPIKQLQSFLPRLDPAASAGAEEGPQIQALRWYDAGRDSDTTLFFDRATGMLRALQQTARPSGAVLTVTYTGWNTPVAILPPKQLADTVYSEE